MYRRCENYRKEVEEYDSTEKVPYPCGSIIPGFSKTEEQKPQLVLHVLFSFYNYIILVRHWLCSMIAFSHISHLHQLCSLVAFSVIKCATNTVVASRGRMCMHHIPSGNLT